MLPLPPTLPLLVLATTTHSPLRTELWSLYCFLWAERVFGGNRRFSCANVSQSAPSNHRPIFSRDRGLRHSLNNLAALCPCALGSQPSKVMTERRWLTSPPIHSHYHLFTFPDSKQTKQKATLGKKNYCCYTNCIIKHSITKQWHFHNIPKSVAFPSCSTLWKKHARHT